MKLEIKTTEDIFYDSEQFELNNLREFSYPKDRLTFYNKKWISVERLKLYMEHLEHSYGKLGLGIQRLKRELVEKQ